jgi:hypothetical protein
VITAGVNIGSLGVPTPHVTLVLVSIPVITVGGARRRRAD